MVLLGGLLTAIAVPAHAQNIQQQCTSLFAQLLANGIVKNIELHGSNPVGFELFVDDRRWSMVDIAAQTEIVRIAACKAIHANGQIRVSGIVQGDQTRRQFGILSLSGDYTPMP